MKTQTLPALAVIAAVSLLIATGCPARGKDDAPVASASTPAATTPDQSATPPVVPVTPTPAETKLADPFSPIAAALGTLPRDQASKIAPMLPGLKNSIDAQVATWKSSGGSNATGEEKLSMARTDFEQKVDALSFADEVTWKNARSDALTSLSELKRSYQELLTGTNNH